MITPRQGTSTTILFTGAVWAALAPGAFAGSTPTFTKDVAPIFFQRCVECHRPGEIAPMSLLGYDEARPWAKSIAQKVAARDMPPWKADPAHGKFSNDAHLTDKEIETIVSWANAGAPRGQDADMPAAPVFSEGWRLGEPDYIVDLDAIDVPAEGPDFFPNIDVTLDLPEDRWVRAVEIRPGNRQVLHHLVSFLGTGGSSPTAIPDFLAVWAVGTPPAVYPEGTGRKVSKNANLRMNMHYHTNGTATTDKSRVGFYFADVEPKKAINGQFAGSVNFRVPANEDDYRVDARYLVDEDIKVISFFPHMHTRGKSMKYTATFPGGKQEVLLHVPEYDFNWQWFYYPEVPVTLPEGTILDIEAHYDNSSGNPNNPDPSKDVVFGEDTHSEMMFGAFEFIPVEGVNPKPVDIAKKLDKVLATYDADSVFKVDADLGRLKLLSGFRLPKEGDGTWYFPFGRQLFEIPISNIQWNEGAFHGDVTLLGRGGITIDGTVSPDGSIQGTFDMGDFDASDIGGGAIQPKGFSGSKLAKAELNASSD